MAIGVLALQGGFAAHLGALRELGVAARAVRSPQELDELDGLVLPGGESTTQLDLMGRLDLFAPLARLHERGVPVLATCAGLIVAAAEVEPPQRSLGWIDVAVRRNAFGTQTDSFAATADDSDTPLVFIRAPRITRVGAGVEVVLRWQGEPVLVRAGHITAATFHPELTADRSIYRACFSLGRGPERDEGGVLQDVEEQLTHRSEHVGG